MNECLSLIAVRLLGIVRITFEVPALQKRPVDFIQITHGREKPRRPQVRVSVREHYRDTVLDDVPQPNHKDHDVGIGASSDASVASHDIVHHHRMWCEIEGNVVRERAFGWNGYASRISSFYQLGIPDAHEVRIRMAGTSTVQAVLEQPPDVGNVRDPKDSRLLRVQFQVFSTCRDAGRRAAFNRRGRTRRLRETRTLALPCGEQLGVSAPWSAQTVATRESPSQGGRGRMGHGRPGNGVTVWDTDC